MEFSRKFQTTSCFSSAFRQAPFFPWFRAACLRFSVHLFVLFLCGPVSGQQSVLSHRHSFRIIGKEQGLRNEKVTSIFQDRFGFVWLGTQGGLYRFDGYECTVFENKPGDPCSLPSDFIAYRGFYEAPNGDLWIATNNAGFSRFDRTTERFQSFGKYDDGRPGLTFEGISALCSDRQSGFFIATMGRGLNHYFPERDSFFNYVLPDNRYDTLMGSNLILSLCPDREGRLWIGTAHGAAILHPDGTFQRFFPKPGQQGSLSADFVYDIFQDSQNRIWLATQNGLNRWVPPDAFVPYYPELDRDVPFGRQYNLIYRVFEDKTGDFWLGTKAGLLRFDPERSDFEPVFHDLLNPATIPDGEIHGIFQDNSGNVWFASDRGAIILNKRAVLFREEIWLLEQAAVLSGIPKDGILDMVEVGGRFWLSTETGLFTCGSGENLRRFLPGHFTKLFVDSQENLWAGTAQDCFYLIDPRQPRTIGKHPKELRNTHSLTQAVGLQNSCFAEDSSGKIWVGTKGVLNRFDPATGIWRQFYAYSASAGGLSNAVINDLYADRRGNLWIATNAGVNLLTSNELQKPFEDTTLRFVRYRHNPGDDNSIGNDRVRAILEDSRGWLWFGTDAGLHRLDADGQWRRFFRENGLPDNKVSGIIEDDKGDIWVCTVNNGLSKFDVRSEHFFHFSKSDGLNTDQFPMGACLKMPSGKLLFAGFEGVNCFDPGQLVLPPGKPPLYFTEFKLFNRPVPVGGEDGLLQQALYLTSAIELRHDQNIISFRFAALNFSGPEKQVYRHRLLPFHREWQYNGTNREAIFTNLDPGDYRLEVETSENGYDWTGTSLVLRIKPPWYRTWWAYLLYGSSLFALLWGIRRYELRRQFAKSEAQRLQALDEAKTRLYANITHEFRTPLTVILGMEEQLRKDPGNWFEEGLRLIRRNAGQLLGLINQMLDLSKLESGYLPYRPVAGDAVNYLRYLTEAFHSYADSKDIRLHFHSDMPELDMDYDPEKLQHVMSNLLSNAIKFTPAGGDVSVDLSRCEPGKQPEGLSPGLLICVSDTGPGIAPEHLPHVFNRFYQADDTQARRAEGTGIGLALVKEMVRLMGGEINAATAEQTNGKGARFEICLPVVARQSIGSASPGAKTIAEPLSDNQFVQPEFSAFIPASVSGERRTVLLVEDNADVVAYLSAVLHPQYRIETAHDGLEGLQKAFELVPDIVVSDVMMPGKDGFELCRDLKTDERTSHIPVILLTARADQASRIEGLTHGADAYLHKPFHREELLVRVEKLIELRDRLAERYGEAGMLRRTLREKLVSLDDLFLQKIVGIVEVQMENEDFGMPQLCKALNMSRTNLFRKLKALTGKSATDFIRTLRLEKARELLQTTDLNVTEVSYAVGFGSPNYFSRMFQETFGMAPSELRKG